jgi:hypothetical protein
MSTSSFSVLPAAADAPRIDLPITHDERDAHYRFTNDASRHTAIALRKALQFLDVFTRT